MLKLTESQKPLITDEVLARTLILVGDRVRDARSQKGISRRTLSEISGVSQRYLAQLESGKGNISIGLLLKIANALECSIEHLVTSNHRENPEQERWIKLLATATPEQRQEIDKILKPTQSEGFRAHRIALVGLRGTGKSTLGRLAAEKLGLHFLELNEEIEHASGMAVHEVFALYGQEGYRRFERQALERVVTNHDTLILAVAGGIVSELETFTYFLKNYHTIWLKADAKDHMARVRSQGDVRLATGNPDVMNELQNILTSREALYSMANTQVNTSNASLSESLADVLSAIEKNGFL